VSLFPPVNKKVVRCPVCGHPMREERWLGEGGETIVYTCFKCGYRIEYHILHEVKKEWFPKSWVEASYIYRLYRSV
jgi:DNA-directed RNA polymerase subunit RPC12/RpoP